ncbi:hypothetical protein B0I08_105200 [Glaciihabitans tibetensis]|uniref:Uncharacterized protein n=1 Tax=Glaciihabitans tibetensis TaxID=1266600 RepID=A0A2T0VCY4_9MICO|nr:hypothetical protein [Glaciihabitans tibetensis]PRY68036.1 hypothetical protein B0I08_105200 [Glaciihabitans tibetensis]
MSNIYPPTPASDAPFGTPASSGTTDTAKEQASHVASDAATAGENVLGTAKEQAASVAGEVTTQAKDLFKQTQTELREQAGTQQKRVAGGLRSLSDELGTMAEKSEGGGVAADLVKQVATRAGGVATWLDDRDPGSLLDEVKTFARTRPGTFIGLAAVAGILAGRLTRSLTSEAADEKAAAEHAAASAPTTTTTPASAFPTATTGVVSAPTVPPVVTPPAADELFAAPLGRDVDDVEASPVDGDPYYRNPRS